MISNAQAREIAADARARRREILKPALMAALGCTEDAAGEVVDCHELDRHDMLDERERAALEEALKKIV